MKYKSSDYTNIDLNETELPQEATLIIQNSMNNVYKCITELTSSSWDNGLNFKLPIWYLKRTLWVESTDLKFNVFFFHRKYQIKPKCYFIAFQKRNFFFKTLPIKYRCYLKIIIIKCFNHNLETTHTYVYPCFWKK